MPISVQLIAEVVLGIVGGIVGGIVIYRRMKVMLFPPPALAGFAASPAEHAAVARAELVLRRGIRTARWPAMFVVFVSVLVSDHVPTTRMSVIVLCGGVAISVAWQMVAIRRWWRWALRQDADPAIVEELAEDAVLVWRHDTWFGRRQRRTWLRLPPRTVGGLVGRAPDREG